MYQNQMQKHFTSSQMKGFHFVGSLMNTDPAIFPVMGILKEMIGDAPAFSNFSDAMEEVFSIAEREGHPVEEWDKESVSALILEKKLVVEITVKDLCDKNENYYIINPMVSGFFYKE